MRAFLLIVIGSNAIVIFVVLRFVDFEHLAQSLFGGLGRLSGSFAPVAMAMGVLAVEWLFLLYLYRKKLFLRV